jgi:Tol biopolymer transport system component
MGEVYKAKDTRLDRSVAVKVLPAHLSDNAEFRQRFEREARAISALSHAHICTLHDVGRENGVDYLVMELLEGETLSNRLLKGPLPAEQTLRYGIQICDALEKAHRQGIIHRDLKPGNIMLTKSGVKLLDFGLVKLAPPGSNVHSDSSLLATEAQASVPLTERGTILGTYQYMPPEQLEGNEADARSDVFALGAILYEMATGKKAFEGKSQASLIAAILEHEPPPISSIQPAAPAAFDRVVRNCLAKDPDDRIQTAHDVKLELRAISEGSFSGAPAIAARSGARSRRELVAWGIAAAALVAAAWLGVSLARSAPTPPQRALRANILLPEKVFLNNAVISPDGTRIAFGGVDATGKVQLWVRPLDAYTATPLVGTEGGILPFWSPDGRYLGFFADKKLKRVEASGGGAPIVLADVDGLGGAWAPDGDIVFSQPSGPLFRLPAAGGKPEPATKLDVSRGETAHRYPFLLPDGRHFLYLALNLAGPRNDPANRIWVGSLEGDAARPLIPANFNAQYADGYLLFVRGGDFGGSLLAQRFDPARLEVSGQPVTIADQVGLYGDFLAFANYTVSEAGTLVYDASQLLTRLEWLDRTGRPMGVLGEPSSHFGSRISPDGSRVAVSMYDMRTQTTQVWVGDVSRGVKTRISSGEGSNAGPVWSPDGSRLAFQSDRKHQADIYVRPAGAGAEEAVTDEDGQRVPADWSKDGRYLLYWDREAAGSRLQQLMVMPMIGERKPFVFLPRSPNDFGFSIRFSPDGRWVAYDVDESGRREVYVVSFPDRKSKVQVSSNGGVGPKWTRGGKEIVYAAFDGKVMSVEISGSDELRVGTPKPLFQPPEGTFGWDVTADGERFLATVPVVKSSATPLSVVVHWAAGLKN